MKSKLFLLALAAISTSLSAQERSETLLKDGWQFHRNGSASEWENVTVPHDWAIYGPFDRDNDLQVITVTRDGKQTVTEWTARSGGLPWTGEGVYRRTIVLPEGRHAVLLFDGAMSEARIFLNGKEIAFWPYGYNSFWTDLSPEAVAGENLLEVRLDNKEKSSRWYPGAGLYRNVHLILTGETYIPVWGTCITTPEVSAEKAVVSVKADVCGPVTGVTLQTIILDADGKQVAATEPSTETGIGQTAVIPSPSLWSPEHPYLYKAVTILRNGDEVLDRYETVFGVRTISISAEGGFQLNGERRQFQGVCLHHDLGPLGSAVNESAIRHQLTLLKDMGCDAIRTSHNMPAPELVRLCNEMGFMMMVEAFDEWDVKKCDNGYHRFFSEWAEKDMRNMILHYRNDPSVVMWSIGNEVPSQNTPDGKVTATYLQDICHAIDPTRPVTCGMNQVWEVNRNGFAAAMDVPGYNYRTTMFLEGMEMLPQGFILGSETASCVSSRGVYHFPPEKVFGKKTPDLQCSSYDEDAAPWSNVPDVDFALADDYPWYLGQFVWTGYDYLGEPHPYDRDSWPSHSSYFGIIDLASIPKDRYYLYRSVWNKDVPTLHILPHWTWPGREGQVTPVYVYTSYPSAELFINGKSQGVRIKQTGCAPTDGNPKADVEGRYRLMWKEAVYEPGEITVVAFDANGNEAARETVHTAGKPARIVAEPSMCPVSRIGKGELMYVTVSVTDRNGFPVPDATDLIKVKVRGKSVRFRAICNGDATCLESFQQPQMHLFSGKLTVILESTGKAGRSTLTVKGKGLRKARLKVESL